MNYKKLSKIFFTSVLLFANSAMAKNTVESCQTKMTTIADISRCLDGVKEKKDRELQTWVNNQSFILEELAANSGRSATLNMFKRSQRNFISYRENNCRWQYLVVAPDASAASAFKKCYITLTQDRINELTNLSR
tara:strand:- start:477 stop:881 length:405 start_codon:yes stop_codon:yes gene_type:complete